MLPIETDNKTQQTPNELHWVTKDGQQCFRWRSNQLTYIAPNRKELPLVLANKFGLLATKLDLSYNNLTSFRNINLFIHLNELVLDNNCLGDDELDFRQNLRLKTLSLNKNKLCDLSKLIISIKVCFPNLEFLSLIGNPFCPIKISPNYCDGSLDIGENLNSPARPHDPSFRWYDTDTCYSSSKQARSRCQDVVSFSSSSSETTTRTRSPDQLALSEGALGVADNRGRANEVDVDPETANQKYRYFIINHLPNLNFLDSSPISAHERDAALNSFFWVENIITNDGRSSSIICGQTLQQQQQDYYSYNAHNISTRSTSLSDNNLQVMLVGEKQVAIYRGDDEARGRRQLGIQNSTQNQNQTTTSKGQLFSEQVKCQMVGSFAIARTLLWTFLSLTSPTNLVHCSGTILALSLKGLKGRRK